MSKPLDIRFAGMLCVLLILATSLLAQRPRMLFVNGRNAGPATLLVRGRTYVDLEILAQFMGGTVTLQPDRVTLAVPSVAVGDGNTGDTTGNAAGNTTGSAGNAQQEVMSREFASAALAAVTLMREWKVAIETMISQQLPIAGTYFQDYQARAEEGMRQANVVAFTNPDRQSIQLLQNVFSNLAKWAGNAIATRQALNATRTMSPDVLKNDVELQKISDCGRNLGTMLASLHFADIPTCH